jgi:uncharacterized protein GlcG (DUF336 family)
MPKTIAKETRNLILHSLAEGMSIRSGERIYDVKLNTIMRYGRLMGQGCAGLLDHLMQKVECKELQVDEFWSFIFKKQQNIKRKFTGYDHEGDIWTYIAIDPVSKVVPSFWIGMREAYDSRVFMDDLAKRCQHRIHLAVADSGGHLVAFQRMDGAMLAAIKIAEHKARAAATFRRPTKVFEDGVQAMRLNYLLAFDDVIASLGGIPLIDKGVIIGGIGVSGGTDSQDEVVSDAGAAVINQSSARSK